MRSSGPIHISTVDLREFLIYYLHHGPSDPSSVERNHERSRNSMSSFKRKGTARQEAKLSGTRLSPTSNSTLITSTGAPSLDDLLGGGLPLSCSLLTLASDLHSSYGDLVQKYFIAQGLACKQHLCVVHHDASQFVQSCMWLGRTARDEPTDSDVQKIKIAWRYDQMKQFQTTVTSSTSYAETVSCPFKLLIIGADQTRNIACPLISRSRFHNQWWTML